MKKLSVLAIAMLCSAAWAQAPAQSSVTIEGKAVSVKYAPAALKSKTFPGVSFHTDADLVFKGATAPKGDYTLYVVAEGASWTLFINKGKGGARNPKLDVGHVTMITSKSAAAESKVSVVKTAARAAKVEVVWDGTTGAAPFHLDRVAGDSEW